VVRQDLASGRVRAHVAEPPLPPNAGTHLSAHRCVRCAANSRTLLGNSGQTGAHQPRLMSTRPRLVICVYACFRPRDLPSPPVLGIAEPKSSGSHNRKYHIYLYSVLPESPVQNKLYNDPARNQLFAFAILSNSGRTQPSESALDPVRKLAVRPKGAAQSRFTFMLNQQPY